MSMLSTTVQNSAGDYSSEDGNAIFSDRELYALLERFCNQVAATQPSYASFLQRYFNDEGYVDIWRIPHAMMDVLLHRTEYNRVFDSSEFRKMFHLFIHELLVFCANECRSEAFRETSIAGAIKEGRRDTSGSTEYLPALMNGFSKVLENLASEEPELRCVKQRKE